VRLAVGARPNDLTRMVVRDALQVILPGTALGIAAAFWVSRLIEAVLFQVSSFDPVAYVSVSAVIVGSALAACYIPAQRAARIDPMAALRCE